MNTREFQDGDKERIEAIHQAGGLDYRMPDLDSKMVVAKAVCEDAGQMVGAIALKLQAETYIWLQPHASPRVKWDAIRLLQAEILRQAMRAGIEQLVAYVPDCIGKFFGKRMRSLKWTQARDGWQAWALEVRGK